EGAVGANVRGVVLGAGRLAVGTFGRVYRVEGQRDALPLAGGEWGAAALEGAGDADGVAAAAGAEQEGRRERRPQVSDTHRGSPLRSEPSEVGRAHDGAVA